MRQSADNIKKLSLELGGNAPFIVFDDADIDTAIEGAIASKYRNAGQTCVCVNRFLVQDGIHDEFANRLAQLKIGNGMAEDTQIGPLINEQARVKVGDLPHTSKVRGQTAIAPILGVSVPSEGQGFEGYRQTMSWVAIYWLAMIMVAINCHQLFILGSDQAHQLKTWRWGRREWRFLGYGIVLGLIIVVLLIPFIVVGLALWSLFDSDTVAERVFSVLLMILLAYLMARLMLVFPAIAVGEKFSWSDARRLSARFQYRLILLIGLLPLVTSTVIEFIPNQDVPWVYALTHLIWLPVLAF